MGKMMETAQMDRFHLESTWGKKQGEGATRCVPFIVGRSRRVIAESRMREGHCGYSFFLRFAHDQSICFNAVLGDTSTVPLEHRPRHDIL